MKSIARAIPIIALAISGCGLFGSPPGPMDGDWNGDMTVSFSSDVRTFTVEVTSLERRPSCDDEPDNEDCRTSAFPGTWEIAIGNVHFGGDANLDGEFTLTHCIADDCQATDVNGDMRAAELGTWVGGASWSDGQQIIFQTIVPPADDIAAVEGDAWYYYTGGGMTGTFSIAKN